MATPRLLDTRHIGSVRQWHWISSALCLAGLLLFAITGITLNNAAHIPATPRIELIETALPDALLQTLQREAARFDEERLINEAPLPAQLRDWLTQSHRLPLPSRAAEWSSNDVYLSLPRPGGDAWLSIDLFSGELLYESTTRGWIAYLNDLHKGRHTGLAWRWFIDLFSLACIVFSITGLVLLLRQRQARPSTFPVTALGLVIPLILALLFIH